MKVQITFTAKLPIKITKKEKWFVAACPALDVASQGEDVDTARKNLKEALFMFLRSCYERGTLDAVLKDCGFSPAMAPAPDVYPPEETIDVPLYLLQNLKKIANVTAHNAGPLESPRMHFFESWFHF